jgi:hypothetical protein
MEQEEEEEEKGEKLCIVHLPSRQSTFWAGPFLILLGLVALPGDQPKVFDSPPPFFFFHPFPLFSLLLLLLYHDRHLLITWGCTYMAGWSSNI